MPRKPKNKPSLKSGFYKEKDYQNELKALRNYWTKDVGFQVALFRIDIVKSTVTNIYGESRAKNKKFLPPVSLVVSFQIGATTNRFMAKSGVNKQEYESFDFNVFIAELEEKEIVINAGDYVLFNDGQVARLFEVNTISNINTTNTIGGFRPFFQHISATLKLGDTVPVELTEFIN